MDFDTLSLFVSLIFFFFPFFLFSFFLSSLFFSLSLSPGAVGRLYVDGWEACFADVQERALKVRNLLILLFLFYF